MDMMPGGMGGATSANELLDVGGANFNPHLDPTFGGAAMGAAPAAAAMATPTRGRGRGRGGGRGNNPMQTFL